MGVNEEDEHSLSEIEYQAKLLERDPDTIDIKKVRYHLHHKGHLVELDVYAGEWEGLCIAEIELPSLDTEVELPDYLTACVDREITLEKGWSNADLAHRYSKPQGVWFGQTGIDRDWMQAANEINDYRSWKGRWQQHEPKMNWFSRLINWLSPWETRYDERNERIYGDQINEDGQ